MFTLSQTVAGSWVITLPNPEERGCETQLAEFSSDITEAGSPARAALEGGAAATLALLVNRLPGSAWQVTSHDSAEIDRMSDLVVAALG